MNHKIELKHLEALDLPLNHLYVTKLHWVISSSSFQLKTNVSETYSVSIIDPDDGLR
jgi:hypothetical protein